MEKQSTGKNVPGPGPPVYAGTPVAGVPDQESLPGVTTFMRVRQCRHDATRLFRK